MRVKTSELKDAALNNAVGVALKLPDAMRNERGHFDVPYSSSWGHGGPIIDREDIELLRREDDSFGARFGRMRLLLDGSAMSYHPRRGPTKLIAAMRCFVASELGDDVDVPDELAESGQARCDDCGASLTEHNTISCPDGAVICRTCFNSGRH